MFYLRNLRVRLQERRNRLYRTGFRTYDAELRYLLQFLDINPYTRSLLDTLSVSPTVDFDRWVVAQSNVRGSVQFPQSEEGRAKVCYGIIERCARDDNGDEWLRWGRRFSSESEFDPMLSDLTEAVVDPFINFLHDQIDDAGNILYLIERFKLKAEWFRRKELYRLYQGDTSVGEASLDQELRASLFEGGVDYPFSQPSSPSGKADIVALLGSDDPLVLEIKVFDPDQGRARRHLQQGFHQVSRYANDYNQGLGYLVIFNCSDRQLAIAPEEASEAEVPARITYAGKTFFAIPIDIHPATTSASKEKPASRLIISHKELIGVKQPPIDVDPIELDPTRRTLT